MKPGLSTIGYSELIRRYNLDAFPHWKVSYLSPKQVQKRYIEEGTIVDVYTPRYDPGTSLEGHLTFALKHEGINLEILAGLFRIVSPEEITGIVKSQPTGKYARMIWFLYEWLTGEQLPLDNLSQGNYFHLLDGNKYYTLSSELEQRSKRHRVINNLFGTPAYSPLVRRTESLINFRKMKLDKKAHEIIKQYAEEILYIATQYLYTKETKSSFEIEKEYPDKRRTARFVELLRTASTSDPLSREELVLLQKVIVDKRFAMDDYRDFQNYVGQTISPTREMVHFVAPKPEDLHAMMEGWITCSKRMMQSQIDPVVTAAVVGFGFVFLHPFEDGNGRLHRYLVHYVLSEGKFTPPGMIFPVSATMLKQLPKYTDTLEKFSRELMKHVEYRLRENGVMTVLNETAPYYRYIDMTYQAERLYEFVNDTIEHELRTELEFMDIFERSRKKISEIVDLPDRKLDLFIRLCIEGKGSISKRKRKMFVYLTDEEFDEMERSVTQEIKRYRK
jgi:Fic family protein